MKAIHNIDVDVAERSDGLYIEANEPKSNEAQQLPSPAPFSSMSKQEQFMALYNPANERLSRFVHSMVWHREDARDIIAETVLKAYESFDKLRNRESFLYFLFGIASRLSKRRGRRNRLWAPFNNEQAENIIDHSANRTCQADIDMLYKAMAKLPEKQREAVSLFDISGFSLAEIQQIQGDSLSAVKSRVTRGRQALAQILNKEYYSNDVQFNSYQAKTVTI